jgi:hypothetical protein
VVFLSASWPVGAATLTLNPARPIDHRVNVRVIQTAADDGSNAAPLFGDATQQSAIFDYVDQIWSQAGIGITLDVQPTTYNDTFALLGEPLTNGSRPPGDLLTIYHNALADGVLDPDPHVLNMFAVRIVPAFGPIDDDLLGGLSFVGGSGVSTVWIGPSVLGTDQGRVGIAALLAHEMGHGLGLEHAVSNTSLMNPTLELESPGLLLSSSEIDTARGSVFAVAVPEPDGAAVLALGALSLLVRRRKLRRT